ncbi:hypothetical protein BS50DRAFT_568620 [Corynespora cassiicola Philippines]|uniref:DUF4139 domain-containing protein n=1 Tax=Corynespora cassiicola Philippines TaxID=1448308 RepID=A0A2T2P6S2_CORCC|nr:hypothetical protein BS50DRAFT_568620 [Corynespora cassiicola Philippines]
MTVELVPNHQIFEEVYPDESESSDDESDVEFYDSEDEEDAVKEISKEIKALQLRLTEAIEDQNSATERLSTLDRYAKTASAEHLNADELVKLNAKYKEERHSIFKVHSEAIQAVADLRKQVSRKEHEKNLAGKEAKKRRAREAKQKAKEKRQRALQKEEKRKQSKYLRQERERYWPKKIYKVTLILELVSMDTPSSSRRGSMDSVTLASPSRIEDVTPQKGSDLAAIPTHTSLLLSYVTREACWSPRYDIRISTVHKTASIVYRTEFLNRTSETWKDTKLSFSTSQTSYQGLEDAVPFMHAWRIRLSRHHSGDGGLLSLEEASNSRTGRAVTSTFNRAEHFGLDDHFVPTSQSKRPLPIQQGYNSSSLFSSSNNRQVRAGGLFGNPSSTHPPPGGGLFGSNSAMPASHAPSAPRSALFSVAVEPANVELSKSVSSARSKSVVGSALFGRKEKPNSAPSENEEEEFVAEAEPQEQVDFEETSWEENGVVTVYEVPGTRTMTPSSMTRRHKIASMNATNLQLSHICVPKLRSAAFLRAKVRNPSSTITLLKGSAGVTLDGSFLGNINIPRVSPGQLFDLPLGVDPAIHVNYPKPSVLRSTQGMIFGKESAQMFSRSIWLNNTKLRPVDLVVLDQAPISEDERLRIAISTPRGLAREGDAVKAGVSAKEGSSGSVGTIKGDAWGSATAKLKKNGEISWDVKLEGGKGCLLKLEYEARLPSGESIVPA